MEIGEGPGIGTLARAFVEAEAQFRHQMVVLSVKLPKFCKVRSGLLSTVRNKFIATLKL